MSSQIKKISNIFLIASYILLIIIPIIIVLQWFAIDYGVIQKYVKPFGFFNPIITSKGPIYLIDHNFSLIERSIGFIGTIIGIIPLIFALIILIKIFRNYCFDNIFSIKNAIYYKYFGYIFFFDALLAKPICQALLTVAATLSNPKGQKEIAITFTNLNLESIFCGAIIIVISHVMYLGAKIQEEQKLVI